MNKVILIGRLCTDPELRYTQNNTAVASYRLAVDRQVKKEGQPEADFFPCVAWSKSALFANDHLRKGMKIAIEGHLQTRDYEKEGVKHYITEVVVDRHEFCEKKTESSNNYGGGFAPDLPTAPAQDFAQIEEDDGQLPF